jgi:hypothetical protein
MISQDHISSGLPWWAHGSLIEPSLDRGQQDFHQKVTSELQQNECLDSEALRW